MFARFNLSETGQMVKREVKGIINKWSAKHGSYERILYY